MYGSSRGKWAKLLRGSKMTAGRAMAHGKTRSVFPTWSEKRTRSRCYCDAMLQYDTSILLQDTYAKMVRNLFHRYWQNIGLLQTGTLRNTTYTTDPLSSFGKNFENGGDVLVGEAHLVHFCALLKKDNANKTGTLLKATNKFSEVEQWFGVWRTREQAVEAVEHIQHADTGSWPVVGSNCYGVGKWPSQSGFKQGGALQEAVAANEGAGRREI